LRMPTFKNMIRAIVPGPKCIFLSNNHQGTNSIFIRSAIFLYAKLP
jgi:hypothetical protein